MHVVNILNTNCLELFSPPPLCPEKDEKDENPPLHPAFGSSKTKAHKCPLNKSDEEEKNKVCITRRPYEGKKTLSTRTHTHT